MINLKQIRIRNFRNLEDAVFEIKPLTLLFGPNASGKSTFFKALKFLSVNYFIYLNSNYYPQKYKFDLNNDNPQKYKFDLNNDIKLGSFKDIVSFGDESKDITYTFDFELNNLLADDVRLNCQYEIIFQYQKEDDYISVNFESILSNEKWFLKEDIEYLLNVFKSDLNASDFLEKYPTEFENFINSEYYIRKKNEYEERKKNRENYLTR